MVSIAWTDPFMALAGMLPHLFTVSVFTMGSNETLCSISDGTLFHYGWYQDPLGVPAILEFLSIASKVVYFSFATVISTKAGDYI